MIHSNHRIGATSTPGQTLIIESHYCGDTPEECTNFSESFEVSTLEAVMFAEANIVPIDEGEPYNNASLMLIPKGESPETMSPRHTFSFADNRSDAIKLRDNCISFLGIIQ